MAAEMGKTKIVMDMLAATEEERLRDWLTKGFFEWERDGYPYWSVLHHGETFWKHKDKENILLLHFSQMKEDLNGNMSQIAKFLNIEVNEKFFPSLVKAAGFEAMKKNANNLALGADFKLWRNNTKFFSSGT